MESEHLPAVLAHELGHLATPDGKLTAAINRLVLIPPRPPRREQPAYEQTEELRTGIEIRDPRIVLTLLTLRIFRWTITRTLNSSMVGSAYGSQAHYGARTGADASTRPTPTPPASVKRTSSPTSLRHALIHDHPVPYIWLTEHTHPPAELRIDKLRNSAYGEIADRSEPVKETPTGPPTAGPAGLPLTEP
jgi:hypothetical protein